MTQRLHDRWMRMTRREAMRRLGLAGVGLAAGCGGSSAPEPTESAADAATVTETATSMFADGAVVRTVLGDVAPEGLANGATLFHEHMSLDIPFWDRLLVDIPNVPRDAFLGSPEAPYFMQDVDSIVPELRAAVEEGVTLLVDGGHDDMGRDQGFLRMISEQSGMAIVASGGYYTDPFHPPDLAGQTDDEIAAALTASARAEGWGAFGEIASSEEITDAERKVFAAIGKAHLATNLPVFTHTANGAEAIAQLDIFESVGVRPDRVVIGHMGGLDDPEATVHKTIAGRGAYVGFDRLGGGPDADGRKVPMILSMLDAGYTERVLLASDFAQASDLQQNGGPGYAKTITQFVPMLREAGVDDATINTLTVENPLRFLAFVPPAA